MPTISDADRTYKLSSRPSADQIISLAGDILAGRYSAGAAVSSPDTAMKLLQLRIGDSSREVFHALFLDNRHRIIHEETLFQGTINSAAVYPREVARAALRCNAAACIVSHVHPSGDAEPSQADISITAELKTVLQLIDVRLLDHVVVSRIEAVSMASRGLM